MVIFWRLLPTISYRRRWSMWWNTNYWFCSYGIGPGKGARTGMGIQHLPHAPEVSGAHSQVLAPVPQPLPPASNPNCAQVAACSLMQRRVYGTIISHGQQHDLAAVWSNEKRPRKKVTKKIMLPFFMLLLDKWWKIYCRWGTGKYSIAG